MNRRTHPACARWTGRHTAALALLTLASLSGGTSAWAAPQTYGPLLSYDFDTRSWPGAAPEAVGTIDTAGSAQPSLGLRSPSLIASGPLPISAAETNLGKFTLAFSLSASAARPVTVRIESYDANRNRTGGLQTLVYPAAPDFYQRYAVDLSSCRPSGAGSFQPDAPYVSFSFSAEGAPWQGVAGPEIRVDNVSYALPAYYVSAGGSDKNTGRSEGAAFATPQKALNAAQPGDIVDVMSGTYLGGTSTATAAGGLNSVASFPRAGTPAAWIVLKNYPGQTPTFFSNGWNIVAIAQGYNGSPSATPLAYLEVRGLHIRGEGDVAGSKYPDSIGKVDSRSNSNGISVDGRYMTVKPHHIRLAGNLVEFCPGGGIGTGEGDWITVEDNVCRNNSWTTIYATSGISLAGTFNYDATVNVYRQLIRNNVCYGNQTFQPWSSTGKISDGNGIIMDVNHTSTASFTGRTLVQSNLSFNNGGSGVHSYGANRVDMVNNTAYLNSASPALQYAQIDANSGDDDRICNNILVAPVANTAAGEAAEPVNGNYNCTNLLYSHNLYFGGNTAPIKGSGDVIADPKFVNPSRDGGVADFHLQSSSPALGTGLVQSFSPYLDLDGRARSSTAPDKGAYELTSTTTALSSAANPSAAGASVVLTAAVTGNTPTGTVTFTDGGATLGTGTVADGVATLSTSALGVGVHSLQAVYGGDPGNTPGTSATLAQSVEGAPTAGSQSATTPINQALAITLTGTDPNTPALPLTYTVTASPTHGGLSGTAPALTYTPAAGYSGPDSFTFTVSNGYLASAPATVSLSVTSATVSGKVSLQSWVGAPQPLTFTLTPRGATTGNTITQTLTPAADGAFMLAGVPTGTYTLGVKGAKWLKADVPVDTATGTVPPVTLLGGDLNGDNAVDINDFNVLQGQFNASGPNLTADINGDGVVDIIDFSILRANFNKAGDP